MKADGPSQTVAMHARFDAPIAADVDSEAKFTTADC